MKCCMFISKNTDKEGTRIGTKKPCVLVRGLEGSEAEAWADGPQRCYHTVSGHRDWCIATSQEGGTFGCWPAVRTHRPCLPSPHLAAAARESRRVIFGQKHTQFPSLKGAGLPGCTTRKKKNNSPCFVQGGHDEIEEGSQGYCVTLGWTTFDPQLILRGIY